MKKVVLAYSGGLDTSVAVAWLREQYGAEVVTLTVDLGGGSLREGRRGARDRGRGLAGVRGGRPRDVRPRLRLAGAPGQRALPGRLPAGHGARPTADRAAARRGRPEGGRGRGRPRLHRQGQRPGPLRRGGPRAGPGPRGRGADAGGHGPLARAVDRLRRGPRHRDPDHEGQPLLHRRQHLGPLVRDRRPGGPVGRPAGRRLRLDRGGRRRAGRGRHRDRLRGRHPGLPRRRATGAGRARRAPQRARRRPRGRADRPRRGPPGRDQEPRDLRGAGRHGPPRRAPRAGVPGAQQGHAALQPPRGGRAGPAHLRRPVVQRPAPRPARVRRERRSGWSPARSGSASTTAAPS